MALNRSAEITQKSQSNLAFALATLPPQRRQDMIHFYAFCRMVDDIADAADSPVETKRSTLAQWRHAALNHGQSVADEIMQETVKLPARYHFSPQLLAEIVDGVSMDLDRQRYDTFTQLQTYCYKVASVVGLVSMHIFGAQQPATAQYAINLGYALQLTNIIRDVGEDARIGRIYLPQDELQRFNIAEADILAGKKSAQFNTMMDYQHARAEAYYQAASAALPRADHQAMIAARMMGELYHRILQKLKAEQYPVFEKRTKLSKLQKAWLLTRYLCRGWLGW
jgi:15-cis-phytoene synthase